MPVENQQSISVKQTDPTSTSRKDTGITDAEMLSAVYDIMRQAAERFGGFKVQFQSSTGKVISMNMASSKLYYCKLCNDFKLLEDMDTPIEFSNSLCKKHSSKVTK